MLSIAMNDMNDSTPASHSPDEKQRLDDLEENLTFQQRALDQMNEVILQQQNELTKLRRELTRYRTEVDRLAESGSGDDLPHEKPPHY